jgi:tRNA (mo5U34)-methyltransferase
MRDPVANLELKSRISSEIKRDRMRPLLERLRNRPIPEALQRELDSEPQWMYPWRLNRSTTAPIHADFLRSIHDSRVEMIEREVRAALAAAGPGARAIDLACNEGWFSQRLLEWGASEVVGVDIRDVNIRRAELVRDHFGIDPDRLEFRCVDLYDLDTEELGQFDVVFLMGIYYHVEDPTGAFRVARRLCRNLCVSEGQVTRLNEPILWGSSAEHTMEALGSFAIYHEPDSSDNPLASTTGVLSLIPNHRAINLMSHVAGFERMKFAKPPSHANQQYIRRDRAVAFHHC